MLSILETGNALYVLMGICVLSILTRWTTKGLYKRLVKESANMTLTKHKGLKDLKQKAENTYRMNQGIRDSGAWLEHHVNDIRFAGLSLTGWSSLANQLTWLCLLLGGTGAFFSYWFRMDTYYVVMYGGGAVLMAMLTMLFDNGTMNGRREHLMASLQDYMENILCPRLSKSMPEEGHLEEAGESTRSAMRNPGRRAEQSERMSKVAEAVEAVGAAGAVSGKKVGTGRVPRRETAKATTAVTAENNTRKDVDYLRRSLEQIAASREKTRSVDENWLRDLKPEEVQLIGDILKEYLA